MSHTSPAARAALATVALHAAHAVADHWVQTDQQARRKGLPGSEGRRACAAHVASYVATQALALYAANRVTGAGIRPGRAALALAVSAVAHYVADRRTPLRRFAEATGLGEFYALGQPREGRDDNPSLGTGAYALDQSWHLATSVLVPALILAGGARGRAGRA
jgi:hypothetical protein